MSMSKIEAQWRKHKENTPYPHWDYPPNDGALFAWFAITTFVGCIILWTLGFR
jgi:hypothetical protein